MEIATKPLVMASEIAGLKPLSGYIKQENRVVPVKFAYVAKRSLQLEFIERKMTIPEPRPVQSVVVPELPAAAIPTPKKIAASATEAALPPAVRQIAAAEPVVLPDLELPLVPEAAPLASPKLEPRKSAFKNNEGTAREWKPVD